MHSSVRSITEDTRWRLIDQAEELEEVADLDDDHLLVLGDVDVDGRVDVVDQPSPIDLRTVFLYRWVKKKSDLNT